jgi:hypothetical protein
VVINTPACEEKAILGDVSKMTDPFTITGVALTGNNLTLVVQYSGGCAAHGFQLVGSEYLSKSLPPIRQVALIHESNGDMCKMLKTDTLCFDIRDLAYKQESASEVILTLQGWIESVNYVFQK